MGLDDPALDSIPSETRDAILLEALRCQIAFMRAMVPFWCERLATVANLLDDDPNLLARHGVRWWIGSSGTFDAKSRALARKQGVESVTNLYGASEFGLFAISCTRKPGEYDVAQGHVLVEVVDGYGAPEQNGCTGRIVVTHLCGMEENGQARVHHGTQILRLAGGDGATLLTEPCDCGLTAPRLRDVHRLATAD